jgi:hypothetical protein
MYIFHKIKKNTQVSFLFGGSTWLWIVFFIDPVTKYRFYCPNGNEVEGRKKKPFGRFFSDPAKYNILSLSIHRKSIRPIRLLLGRGHQ